MIKISGNTNICHIGFKQNLYDKYQITNQLNLQNNTPDAILTALIYNKRINFIINTINQEGL